LDRQRPELFYRLPPGLPSAPPAVIFARVREAVGEDVPVRFADDVSFGRAIRASTAIPVLFDPVTLRSREDTLDRYVESLRFGPFGSPISLSDLLYMA
jgi:predicted acylesterase/phospholipase RssA